MLSRSIETDVGENDVKDETEFVMVRDLLDRKTKVIVSEHSIEKK